MRATAEDLATLHALLERFWSDVDRRLDRPPDATWRAKFDTAVAEVAANIIKHAHPPGGPVGPLRLELRAFHRYIEAHFSDRGLPFRAPEPLASARTEPYLADDPQRLLALPESGYGLALVRAAVDSLDYSRSESGGNVWLLVKRLEPLSPQKSEGA